MLNQTIRAGVYISLPNKQGHYKPVRVPQYILSILDNVKPMYDYTYRLMGTNPQRTGYGIEDDLAKLEAWVKRYHADFIVKRLIGHNRRRRGVDFFIPTAAIFEMTDPVSYQLEKLGLLDRG